VTFTRRSILQLASGAAALPLLPRAAQAETYPTHPVRVIVGFPAGQAADSLARIVAQGLSERLKQQFVVENRPGAGGNIGSETVAHAAPGGYTILVEMMTSNAINASLYKNLNFDFRKDIAPVALIGGGAYVMTVNPEVPATTVPEFISYAKTNPGKINMGSAGIGTPPHAFGELFKMLAHVDMVHVPYNGSYVPDLLSGQLNIVFAPIPTVIAHIKSGKLRALAVTSTKRSPALPDTPTIAEFVPGYDASGYFGFGAEQDAGGYRRHLEQDDQRRDQRCGNEGEARRARRRAADDDAGAVRQAHRRRDREVGEGRRRRAYGGGLAMQTAISRYCTASLRLIQRSG
jgi:tripartite-type tricarboxylate transporter receptor subunit TctC